MERFLPILPVLALAVTLDDWPRWRGPTGDGHVPVAAGVPVKLPADPHTVWRQPVGEGLGSPVVADGRLFHLDAREGKEVVHALEAATGKELWNATLDDTFKDNQSAPGPRTTPLVDGDRVYVQSCRGEFQCLDVANGKRVWGVHFGRDFGAAFQGETGQSTGASRHGNTGSPVVDGERIILCPGGTNGASVAALDKRDGHLLWKSLNDPAAYVGPVLADLAGRRQAIVFTAEAVVGLDPASGAQLWRVPVKTAFGRHIAAPIVWKDLVIVSSHQAGLQGIRVTIAPDGFSASVAWTNREQAMNMASPVLVADHLYGLGAGRKLVCVDAKTGAGGWSERSAVGGPLVKDIASFLVLHDKILSLTYDGTLLLFEADPAGFRLISSVPLCGKTWCAPAYIAGRLYFRDDKELRCVDLL